MTGAPTDASSECGHAAAALLDFHVNGSLEGEEAAMVAAHVAECSVCARDVRELRSLAAAIEAHGVAPASAWRGGPLWAWIGTAAAVLVLGVVVYRFVPRGPADLRVAAAPAQGDPAGAEVPLDLGVGGLRDGVAGTPHADLAPGVTTLRLTFLPPVVPHLRLRVLDPGGKEIVPEQGLPGRDAMNRVTIAIAASAFTTSGIHQVILTSAAPDSGDGPFSYSFEVQIPADRP